MVPTTGGERLPALVRALSDDRPPHELVVVDDRVGDAGPLIDGTADIRVVSSGGRGAAAARNVGLRATSGEWVVFLDDHAVLTSTWYDDLLLDLERAHRRHVAVHARIEASDPETRPASPTGRPASTPTDVAYRRLALVCLGGFEERFPRAGREDVDVVLRAMRAGWRLAQGARVSLRDSVPDVWQVPEAPGVLQQLRSHIAGRARREALSRG
ncbi:MAG TPA: glycosyltransferase [Candidatus Nanopelagicales bacterium]|nr:glycosyltransferase [Candidatus Nanopelagicales bacterium]